MAYTRTLSALMTAALLGGLAVPASAQDLADGDWLVAGQTTIWRVRDGTAVTWCESPPVGAVWSSVHSLLVDSLDRVIFLAGIAQNTLLPPGVTGLGLFRCESLGGATSVLGLFPTSDYDPQDVVGTLPFPGDIMDNFISSNGDDGGLHLAKRPIVSSDDDVDGGKPEIDVEDVYVFGLGVRGVAGGPRVEVRIVEYRPNDLSWHDGPQVVTSVDGGGDPDFIIPDMVASGGDTYSGAPLRFGRTSEPLDFTLKGEILGNAFTLGFSLFGGLREPPYGANGLFLDDVGVSGPEECDPGELPYSNVQPRDWGGPYLTFFQHTPIIAVDNAIPVFAFQSFLRFGHAMNFETLLKSPGNDGNYFLYSFGGCTVQPWLKVARTDPNVDPGTREVAAGDAGLAAINATQLFVVEDGDEAVIIEDLPSSTGLTALAGYPPQVSTSLKPTIIIRIDSPIEVLVTTPSGGKLGLEGGLGVNELGNRGFDSGPPGVDEPRVYAIHGAELPDHAVCPNPFAVDAVATGSGPYTFHVYTLDLANQVGEHITLSGNATMGQNLSHLGFSVAPSGTVFFDRDGDGLANDVETNTGVYVSPSDTGSNPDVFDTDGDGVGDGEEVALGTDPNIAQVPALGGPASAALVGAMLLVGWRALRHRSHRPQNPPRKRRGDDR